MSRPNEAFVGYPQELARERRSLRLGAVLLVLGSIAVLAFRLAHGDLPTETGEAALSYVASYPLYPVVHLGDCLGVLVWVVGLVALSGSLTQRDASAIGRLGAASALIGAAVHIAEFSIDGYALTTLAGPWAVASAPERQSLESGARLVLVALGGPSTSALLILWGVTLPLYGLAVQWEGYPAWFARVGMVVGAVITVLGVVQFVRPNVVFNGVLLYGGGTIASQIWTFSLGIAMWRRGLMLTHGDPASTGS